MSVEAGLRLEAFLEEAIKKFGVIPVVDTGAKQGIQSLNDVMAEIKDMLSKSMDGVKTQMLEQGKKMANEYQANGELVVKKMQVQHDDAMHQFNDLLGNERAGD